MKHTDFKNLQHGFKVREKSYQISDEKFKKKNKK